MKGRSRALRRSGVEESPGTESVARQFLLACGYAVAAAVAFYPALRARPRVRFALWMGLSGAILVTPLFLPPHTRILRFLAAVLAVALVAKMWDTHVGAARHRTPGFGEYLLFLPNIFSLVHRKLDEATRPSTRRNVRDAAVAVLLIAPTTWLLVRCFSVDWSRHGIAAEHAAKVVLFFMLLIPLTTAAGAVWHVAGGRGIEFMRNPFAARTPADFWRRYNRPVSQFLREDVASLVGGRTSRFRGALAAFVVSAVIHEYVFSIAIARVQGYQMAFFLLQGLAAAATARAKPVGYAAAASASATFVFNLASGILFFASVNGVVPFYENPVPLWDEGQRTTGDTSIR